MNLNAIDRGSLQSERATLAVVAALFGLVALLAAVDVIADLGEGTSLSHLLIEVVVVVVGLSGVGLMVHRWVALARVTRVLAAQRQELATRLEASTQEADRWRQEAAELLRGLSASIDDQLTRWRLTAAEKEVALLLLKGLTLKEVAQVRSIEEGTARQQARAVYRKAGLAGRSELAAFFLEDLLLPSAPSAGAPVEPSPGECGPQ